MAAERAISCFEKQLYLFSRHIIQVDGYRCPVFAPNLCRVGDGRKVKARQGGAIRKKSERRAAYPGAIGKIIYFKLKPWLLKWLVIWILEYYGIMIDQCIGIAVSRNSEFI